jgi:site-specific DNA-cytosine methylase
MGPSGHGGEDQKTQEMLEHFQQTINRLEKNLNELKEAQKEALSKGRQGQAELCSVQEGSNYDIAELFSPVRMTAMAKEYGLKGGWSIDDRCTDPITGRTYDLRTKKDQNEVRRLIKRDRPLVLTVSPPCTLFSIANQGPIDPRELAGAVEMIKFAM